MLIQTPQMPLPGTQDVIYPVLQTELVWREGTPSQRTYLVPSCCFHDLLTAPSDELAGVGLVIIGNLCRMLQQGELADTPNLTAHLWLKHGPGDHGIELPWPGLADDTPMALDLAKMPWDSTMFADEHGTFRYRVNRLSLMARIEDVWVAHLERLLGVRFATDG